MANAYDEIVRMYKEHPEYGELGIFAGYSEASEPDHLPRCDCGHLFEICDYPNCPCAVTADQHWGKPNNACEDR